MVLMNDEKNLGAESACSPQELNLGKGNADPRCGREKGTLFLAIQFATSLTVFSQLVRRYSLDYYLNRKIGAPSWI